MPESPPNIELRRARPEDAQGLLDLIIGLAQFEELTPPDEAAQKRLIQHAFEEPPRFEPWLAFVEGRQEPVAYAILFSTYSTFLALPTLYLEDLFVHPSYRKLGIGSAMLRQIVSLARERGCGRVEWTALDWNVNAQRVYEQTVGAKRMKEWYLYRMTREDMDQFLGAAE